MQLVTLVASVTKRRTIVSSRITDVSPVPAFGTGDKIEGKIVVLSETGDPTDPTKAFPVDGSSLIALSDGMGNVYAPAIIGSVSNSNELNFSMLVSSGALDIALAATTEDFIEAFLEARVNSDTQDMLLLREPTTIERAATIATK